jgi:hypothetical protein
MRLGMLEESAMEATKTRSLDPHLCGKCKNYGKYIDAPNLKDYSCRVHTHHTNQNQQNITK